MIETLIIIFGSYLIFGDDEPDVKQKEPAAQVQEVEVQTRRAIVTINDGLSQSKHESLIVIGDNSETQQALKDNQPVSVKTVTRNNDGYIIADLSGD